MRDRTPFDEALIPMSVGELNHLMTYVTEAWMLFSLGFVSIGFGSFVSRRIQEDLEAEAVALKAQPADKLSVIEAVESTVVQTAPQPVNTSTEVTKASTPESPAATNAEPPKSPIEQTGNEPTEEADPKDLTEEDEVRLEEIAAVSEQLSKTKSKQSDASSVSVST